MILTPSTTINGLLMRNNYTLVRKIADRYPELSSRERFQYDQLFATALRFRK